MISDPGTTDAIIVGGGPAGLSAALVLGRCRRRVIVFDSGEYRNAASHAMHGFLSRDGIAPQEMRRISREQLARYTTVSLIEDTVVDARRSGDGFVLTTASGGTFRSRKLVIATGIMDELPSTPGTTELFGRSIFPCPYCDGWEVKDQPLAVYGRGDDKGGGLALEMIQWSKNVVLFTDGPSELSDRYRARLERYGIDVVELRILRFESSGLGLTICFADGSVLEKRAIFFNTSSRQRSDLAIRLGCELDHKGGVKVDRFEATSVPGLYVAGDASREVLQAIVGAGEGSEAAIEINIALLEEDLP
jgi:thioredoxin reductase